MGPLGGDPGVVDVDHVLVREEAVGEDLALGAQEHRLGRGGAAVDADERADGLAAAEKGWVDERAVVLENWHAFRRAGADIIITYHGRQALASRWL